MHAEGADPGVGGRHTWRSVRGSHAAKLARLLAAAEVSRGGLGAHRVPRLGGCWLPVGPAWLQQPPPLAHVREEPPAATVLHKGAMHDQHRALE